MLDIFTKIILFGLGLIIILLFFDSKFIDGFFGIKSKPKYNRRTRKWK